MINSTILNNLPFGVKLKYINNSKYFDHSNIEKLILNQEYTYTGSFQIFITIQEVEGLFCRNRFELSELGKILYG